MNLSLFSNDSVLQLLGDSDNSSYLNVDDNSTYPDLISFQIDGFVVPSYILIPCLFTCSLLGILVCLVIRRFTHGCMMLPYTMIQVIKLIIYQQYLQIVGVLLIGGGLMLMFLQTAPAFLKIPPEIYTAFGSLCYSISSDVNTMAPLLIVCERLLFHTSETYRESPKGMKIYAVLIPMLIVTTSPTLFFYSFCLFHSERGDYFEEKLKHRGFIVVFGVILAISCFICCLNHFLVRRRDHALDKRAGPNVSKRVMQLTDEKKILQMDVLPTLLFCILMYIIQTVVVLLVEDNHNQLVSICYILCTIRSFGISIIWMVFRADLREEFIANSKLWAPPPPRRLSVTKVHNIYKLGKDQADILTNLKMVGLFE